MNITFLRKIVLLLLLSLSFLTRSPAAETDSNSGLLGTNYFGATYAWHNLSDSPVDAYGFAFECNWVVRANLDFSLNYDWLQTDEFFGLRARQQTVLVGLRSFTAEGKTRYYFEAAAGWAWADVGGMLSDDSSVYRLGIGAEFTLTPSTTVTPFIFYQSYGSSGSSGTFNYGLKANAWVSRHWALTASLSADDNRNTAYALGVNFHF